MDIAVPSRFACLKIEDDDLRPSSSNSSNKKKIEAKTTKKSGNKKSALDQNVSSNKNQTSSSSSSNKKQKSSKQSEKQWEDWKKLDSDQINENFEQDMESAILQSKIDYEMKKANQSKSNEKSKPNSSSSKKKKSKTMSLDQFLDKNEAIIEEAEVVEEQDEAFFDKLIEEAKREVTQFKVEEQRREREVDIDRNVILSKFQEKLKKEKTKNAALEKELKDVKAELASAKERNHKISSILAQAEMKEKTDILYEVDNLTTIRNDLTKEVERLHKLLEQERSKNVTTDTHQSAKHKEKKNKKH